MNPDPNPRDRNEYEILADPELSHCSVVDLILYTAIFIQKLTVGKLPTPLRVDSLDKGAGIEPETNKLHQRLSHHVPMGGINGSSAILYM